jgi:hypothetical protein
MDNKDYSWLTESPVDVTLVFMASYSGSEVSVLRVDKLQSAKDAEFTPETVVLCFSQKNGPMIQVDGQDHDFGDNFPAIWGFWDAIYQEIYFESSKRYSMPKQAVTKVRMAGWKDDYEVMALDDLEPNPSKNY